MANELEVYIRAVMNDPSPTGFLKNQRFDLGATRHDLTNRLVYMDTVLVPAADTLFVPGNGITAATQGHIAFVNLDLTNYVDFGPVNGGAIIPGIRLKPKKKHWTELIPGVTYHWRSNAAPCWVLVFLLGV